MFRFTEPKQTYPDPSIFGGQGSGNFGHSGRSGVIGGSGEGSNDSWTPTKSLQEANRFVNSSEIKEPLFHATSKESASNIREEGFKNSTWGFLGQGSYFTTNPDIGDSFGSQRGAVTLEVRVNVSSVMPEDEARRISENDKTLTSAQFTKIVLGLGYDSIRFQDQVVVFEPKKIVIVETPSKASEFFESLRQTLQFGGPGSGNFGHSGIPGQVGGSGAGGGDRVEELLKVADERLPFFNKEMDKWTRASDHEARQNAFDYATRDFPKLGEYLREEQFGKSSGEISLYRSGTSTSGLNSYYTSEVQAQGHADRFGVDSVYHYSANIEDIVPTLTGAGEVIANKEDLKERSSKASEFVDINEAITYLKRLRFESRKFNSTNRSRML